MGKNRGGSASTSTMKAGAASVKEELRVRTVDAPGSKAASKAARKREKQAKMLAHLSVKSATVTPSTKQALAFGDVDDADHCETPFKAYRDIEPFLFALAKAMKRTKGELKIYDPYFCEGSMKAHLRALGFESVYNENEDFYEKVATRSTPEYDVLVTNPPYSGDHFKRILEFCRDSNKPWLLLLPNFVCRKTYYAPSIGAKAKPMFLIPDAAKPYRYWAPGRQGFETRAKGTTPFETFWYINFNDVLDAETMRTWWIKKYSAHSTCDIPSLSDALPQQQRLQKRPNPKVRAMLASKGVKNITSTQGLYFDPAKAAHKKRKDHD